MCEERHTGHTTNIMNTDFPGISCEVERWIELAVDDTHWWVFLLALWKLLSSATKVTLLVSQSVSSKQ